MPLSPSPDLSSSRRLLLTGVLTTLGVLAYLVWRVHDVATSLGDTDDAMRLVLVRDLLHGRGWYDQWVGRLQPPFGVYMHWSRLLDGALAVLNAALAGVLAPAQAETAMRFVWPLMWIFPVTLAGLAVARSVGGRSAVFVCAILLVLDISLYVQFRPGRIDHHDIQITMTMVAAACALVQGDRQARWPALAGAASALGLAIGVEALAFHALIGASFALGLMADRKAAAAARAYGLALALASLAFFTLQTPPSRWLLPFCDAIGANLVAALVVGGLGLALAAALADRLPAWGRIAGVALAGAVAGGVYVALDPICLHGPFASVDPRVRSFWFDHIQELEAWPALLHEDRNAALHSIVAGVLAALAAVWLAVRGWRQPRRGEILLAACTALAVAAQAKAYRMEDYGLWFGTPALAIVLSDLGARLLKDRMIPVALMAVLLSPATLADAAIFAAGRGAGHPARVPIDRCYDTASYGPLARLPAGLVLAEPDLGSFVLANTGDTALSAPYHRMTWGILAAHDVLAAPAAQAEAQVRALRVGYIVDCPVHVLRTPQGGLGGDLRRGRPPAWLQPLSRPGQALQIYRVAPAAAPQGRP
ncbi:MAG: hypothetical protein P4L73_17860 [Caulobacteraceae bacterium]|nr:hypothetical protein [Caulobacteraceae bacterium]